VFTARRQVSAQGASDRGKENIVHRCIVPMRGGQDVIGSHPRDSQAAIAASRFRQGAPCCPTDPRMVPDASQFEGAPNSSNSAGQRMEAIEHRIGGQMADRWWRQWEGTARPWGGCSIDQCVQNGQTSDAVGECVLDHENQRYPAICQACHDGRGPEWAVNPQRTDEQSRGNGEQRRFITQWRTHDVTEVLFRDERGVIDPDGPSTTPRHPHGALTHSRNSGEPFLERPDEHGDIDTTCGFDAKDRPELVGHGRMLHRQVHGISCTHTIHRTDRPPFSHAVSAPSPIHARLGAKVIGATLHHQRWAGSNYAALRHLGLRAPGVDRGHFIGKWSCPASCAVPQGNMDLAAMAADHYKPRGL
jgi:hypothetical protein